MLSVRKQTAVLVGMFSVWVMHGFAPARAAGELQLNRDIRPVLSENCFACHGPDARARQGDLRLDTEEGLFGKRDGGPAVVRG